jgi:Fe-S oxidoreductase
MGEPHPFEVLSIIEFIAREQSAGSLTLKQQPNGTSVSYQDPCWLSRKGGILEEPRNILKSMGFEVRETEAHGREDYCCGGGCGEYVLSTGSALRHKVFNLKRHQFEDAGADKVVTACASCRYNLLIGAKKAEWDTPIASLVETVAANLAD